MHLKAYGLCIFNPNKRLTAFADVLAHNFVGVLPCVVLDMQLEQVMIPKAKNGKTYSDYGFVHFKDRGSAVKLVEQCDPSASGDPRRLEFPPESGNFLQVRPM